MAVVKLTINKRMAEALGMTNSGSAFGAWDGGTWKSADADEAILAADALVRTAIMLTPGHGRRAEAESTSSTAHGALIAAHLGLIGAVTFAITGGPYAGTRGAKLVSQEEVEIDNLNPQGLTRISPKYALQGSRLFHNAAALVLGGASSITVNADICTYTLTSSCQAPDEAADAVFHLAMSTILKDGQNESAAATYRQMAQQDLVMLGIEPGLVSALTSKLDERFEGRMAA